MNVIRKEDKVNVFLYSDDLNKEQKELQRELAELVSMLSGLSVNLKLMEVEDINVTVLSLILSFAKSIQKKNSRIVFFVTDNLGRNLFELGLGNLPDGIEKIND